MTSSTGRRGRPRRPIFLLAASPSLNAPPSTLSLHIPTSARPGALSGVPRSHSSSLCSLLLSKLALLLGHAPRAPPASVGPWQRSRQNANSRAFSPQSTCQPDEANRGFLSSRPGGSSPPVAPIVVHFLLVLAIVPTLFDLLR